MKKFTLILFSLISIFSIFAGCKSDHEVEGKLAIAYSLLDSNPDSTLAILKNINKNHLPEAQKARYALIHVIAQDKNDIDVKDDSLLSIAKKYYENREKDTLYPKFCYYQGSYYVLLDSLKQAEEYLWRSIQAANLQKDNYTGYLACFQMSRALSIRNPEKSLTYSKSALELYESIEPRNVSNEIYLIREIGTRYNSLGETDSALYYMKKALMLARESNNASLIGKTLHSISKAYMNMDRPDSALHYATLAWSLPLQRDPSLYAHLGNCYIKTGDWEKAESILKEGSLLPASPYTYYTIYNSLLKISLARSKNDDAATYSDSAQAMLKRIYYSSESENASYQKDNHDLENQKHRIESVYNKSVYIAIFVISFLLLVILIILLIYYYSRKATKIKMEYEKKRHEHELKLIEVEHQKDLEIEEIKLKEEQERLQLLSENREKQLILMKRYFMSKSQYRQQLRGIKSGYKNRDLSDEDWLEVEILLNETFPDFMINLRKLHPNMEEIDYRDCILLKLDLSNSDFARFYSIELPSVKQKLFRLKNKLSLEKGNVSARDYIRSFSL